MFALVARVEGMNNDVGEPAAEIPHYRPSGWGEHLGVMRLLWLLTSI